MRATRVTLACMLALTVPIAAHAVSLGGKVEPGAKGPKAGIIRAWGGCGWGWHPVPGHWSQWRGGWVPPHCAPNREGAGWGGPYGGQGNAYGGWGGYGGGQGPYGGWRNYGGGWGNP